MEMNTNQQSPRDRVSLNDKYNLTTGRAFMTGIEALVRLPLVQHQRDTQYGLNTAGYVSGYRGSPLGTLDQSMWQAAPWLERHSIVFQPGVNEDLAATAVWGTQQTHLLPGAKYDGIFAMWYGKGPGVDRSMDAIKHANMFGTTKHGGVLAIAGDDHACKSSTLPHQSEHMFVAASVPVLNPANIQDILDYGIYGWALSRFCGCWVAIIAINENMDSAISADLDPGRVQIKLPESCRIPLGGLNAQWPTTPLEQETLLNKYRIYAAISFAQANNLNRVMMDSPLPRLGIVTSGKSYFDVMEALNTLGIDKNFADTLGLRIFKVGMSWPLEPVAMHKFAQGLNEILVVEEKRSLIQDQITGQLYNWPVNERPVVVGEFDENGNDLITNLGELTTAMVARAIGTRILKYHDSQNIRDCLEFLDAKERRLSISGNILTRTPYFCSGCPHNTSTKVPEGSYGLAGIGCHYMAKWMNRRTETFTQMGGEGASWLGQAPFTDTRHVFQNLGDGTYFHSGILAIRAAIASGVNITYKLLYNDAVAMTGGQPVDGTLGVSDLVAQLKAEGVERLAVVAENFERARETLRRYPGITIHPKSDFDRLQEEIREVKGTSVIIFDQTCAAEKRRRRKRGLMPESPVRVFIHPEICEGCGDCSTQSNCLSVLPKKTALGTKRQIDQGACNQDFSCLKGFCPSFITVTGGQYSTARDRPQIDVEFPLPTPPVPDPDRPWNILVAGVGGTGVLTVGSILAMAAHIEGKGCSTLNQTGLAQKFGAVVSHVRIARAQSDIFAVRIPDRNADLLLGCDLVVSASRETLARFSRERTHAVVNSYENPTADFIHDKNYQFPAQEMRSIIKQEAIADKTEFTNATVLARDLTGNAIGSNLFLLGYAFQQGLIPVSEASILKAIELNGVAVKLNCDAFTWGRRTVIKPELVQAQTSLDCTNEIPESLDELIRYRYSVLVSYQNSDYADRYLTLLETVRNFEQSCKTPPDDLALTATVAQNYFRLLAYKDEYEIARLFSENSFIDEVRAKFQGNFTLDLHMAPPLLSKKDTHTGHLLKRRFPGSTLKILKLLSKLKFLRGSIFDIFGRSPERKLERKLIVEYEDDVKLILSRLADGDSASCLALANLPEVIRGFGHIKLANIEKFYSLRSGIREKVAELEKPVA